ncbi:MAG: GTPase ObgE [Oligoflexia bacterium]|nr:GTPase ObgE [Oligoflexia bacterium]
MKFVDEAKILVKSGHGGPGIISWRREKSVPRGGPDGGDGGKGGDVIFEVSRQLGTLLDLKFVRKFLAEDGKPGERQNMTGHAGNDMVIQVPEGTLIKSPDGEVICDMSGENSRFVYLRGGRGGKGNQFFKNSVNQAPKFAQPGEDSQEAQVVLELKLLADVGIIGFPNAGKSTLISRISAAKPKIADYPFTTLVPNLGVVQAKDFKSFVVADIPGLIKDAHKGAGLGIKFLRHIERTRFFLHVVDASAFSGRDPVEDYEDINRELEYYDKDRNEEEGFFELGTRPQIVVLNKVELLDEKTRQELVLKFRKKRVNVHLISAVTGLGIRELIDKMTRLLSEENEKVQIEVEKASKAKKTSKVIGKAKNKGEGQGVNLS